MMQFNAFIARVPRLWLYAAAGLIQLALIAAMVADRVRILRTGTEVTLKTRAVDPRDLFRGDYVTLGYDITAVETGPLKGTPSDGKGAAMYVKLAPGPDGFYKAVSLHRELVPAAAGEVMIRGYITSGGNCEPNSRSFCSSVSLGYGIESFFVPQGEGHGIEAARNQGKVAIVAAVTSGGRAAIKRLLLDGEPVYDEPMF